MSKFLLAVLFALPGCGGHVILAQPDSGEPTSNTTCATDTDCVNGSPGSCQRGECVPLPAEDGGNGEPATGPVVGKPFPICPGVKPEAGSPCPTANQGCAYVDVAAGTCESWTCSASNQWVWSTPAGC